MLTIDPVNLFVALKLHISPPDPVKCLVEDGCSNSGSGDQVILHRQRNHQYQQKKKLSGACESHYNGAGERTINMVVTLESTMLIHAAFIYHKDTFPLILANGNEL